MADNVLLELTDTEYQQWRHSPTTKAFLQYLADQAEAFRKDLMARWAAGNLVLSDEHKIAGIVQTLDEVSELQLQVIRRFYLGDSVDEAKRA